MFFVCFFCLFLEVAYAHILYSEIFLKTLRIINLIWKSNICTVDCKKYFLNISNRKGDHQIYTAII